MVASFRPRKSAQKRNEPSEYCSCHTCTQKNIYNKTLWTMRNDLIWKKRDHYRRQHRSMWTFLQNQLGIFKSKYMINRNRNFGGYASPKWPGNVSFGLQVNAHCVLRHGLSRRWSLFHRYSVKGSICWWRCTLWKLKVPLVNARLAKAYTSNIWASIQEPGAFLIFNFSCHVQSRWPLKPWAWWG